MTVKKTDAELQKALLVKVLRSQIRLKHTIEAERELNEVLPKAEKDFDKKLQHDDADIEERARKALNP
jgi:cell division protein FtsB